MAITPVSKSQDAGPQLARRQQPLRSANVIDIGPEGRWLLVCAQSRARPTSLTQLDVCSAKSDRELFSELKRAYTKLRGRIGSYFSLRAIQSIKFVQVSKSMGHEY